MRGSSSAHKGKKKYIFFAAQKILFPLPKSDSLILLDHDSELMLQCQGSRQILNHSYEHAAGAIIQKMRAHYMKTEKPRYFIIHYP